MNRSPGIFFTESWTLAVEVWFYLTTPILLFAALKIAPSNFRYSTFFVIIASIVVITILRSKHVTFLPPLRLFGARMAAMYRVDACLFGLFGAWLKYFYPDLFPRGRRILCAIGLALIAFAVFAVAHSNESIFYRRVSFTASPLGAMMLLPLMDSWRAVPRGGNVVGTMALWAYSLYLANMPVHRFLQYFLPAASPLLKVFLFLLICFAIAEFVFRYFEKPAMDLRDRWPFRRRAIARPEPALERQTAGV